MRHSSATAGERASEWAGERVSEWASGRVGGAPARGWQGRVPKLLTLRTLAAARARLL